MAVEMRIDAPRAELIRIATALRQAGDGRAKSAFIKEMRAPVNKAKKDVQQTVRALPVSAHRTWSTASSAAAKRTAYTIYRRTAKMDSQQLAFSRAYAGGRDAARRARSAARTSGLRESIARGIGTSVRTSGHRAGLAVKINTGSMPPDQRKLPYHLDTPKGWRHPLFGDRSYWVQQQGKPYFAVTLNAHEKEYRAAAEQVLSKFAAAIMRGSLPPS